MASRIDDIIGERTARRQEAALDHVVPLLLSLRSDGFDVVVIGSLARGEFRSHSDVDFLVRGKLDASRRAALERAVAAGMRGAGVPYDLVYAADVAPDRLKEFERDHF